MERNELYETLAMIAKQKDFSEARKLADAFLDADTVIPAEMFLIALKARMAMYNPADYGMIGKLDEVEYRINGWLENGRNWCKWGELHARRHGMVDARERYENKTGCGDWLYSRRFSDWDRIVAEYSKKQTMIRWATTDFEIICTWAELFAYLASYNDKGLKTWFKSNLKRNAVLSETVVMMQEYKTSKKKIAFLQACPYNR